MTPVNRRRGLFEIGGTTHRPSGASPASPPIQKAIAEIQILEGRATCPLPGAPPLASRPVPQEVSRATELNIRHTTGLLTISETGARVPTFQPPITILPPRIARFSARLSW